MIVKNEQLQPHPFVTDELVHQDLINSVVYALLVDAGGEMQQLQNVGYQVDRSTSSIVDEKDQFVCVKFLVGDVESTFFTHKVHFFNRTTRQQFELCLENSDLARIFYQLFFTDDGKLFPKDIKSLSLITKNLGNQRIHQLMMQLQHLLRKNVGYPARWLRVSDKEGYSLNTKLITPLDRDEQWAFIYEYDKP